MFFNQLAKELKNLVAEIDDLKTAVTALTTAVGDASTELNNVAQALLALKNQSTINPADVEAAAQTVSTLAANLETAVNATKSGTGV